MEEFGWHYLKNKEKPPLGEIVVVDLLLFDDISFMEVQGVNTNEGIKLIEPVHYEKGYIQLAWRYKTESEKLKEKLKGE